MKTAWAALHIASTVASVCSCMKMINDVGERGRTLGISSTVARATEWSETRPHPVRFSGHTQEASSASPPPSLTSFASSEIPPFFRVLVETTCDDDVEHTWREQVREKSVCPPPLHCGKAYTVNGCRLCSACKILIKVRYLAKRLYLMSRFFSLSWEQMLVLYSFNF